MRTEKGQPAFSGEAIDRILTEKIIAHSRENIETAPNRTGADTQISPSCVNQKKRGDPIPIATFITLFLGALLCISLIFGMRRRK